MNDRELLESGLQTLDLPLALADPIDCYLDLLLKWNQVYNLTAVRTRQAMLQIHIFDCLAILPYLPTGNLIDVGTGAGLPGILIALAQPERFITLLDSNQKKINFLFQVKAQCALQNVQLQSSRVEQFQPEEKFSVAVSRAFSSLQDMVDRCAPLLQDGGSLIAMKGQWPHPEDALNSNSAWQITETIALEVPFLQAERHLLILKKLIN